MKTFNKGFLTTGLVLILALLVTSCGALKVPQRSANKQTPDQYLTRGDSTNAASMSWRKYFSDPYLLALIDTALHQNQELNILLHEIEISRNEIRARKGEYLPFVGITAGGGLEREARYTRNGAVAEAVEIKPGKPIPAPFGDVGLGLSASWELDIWKKLRNARKAAALRYLSTTEGRNFMVTRLISEIATSYYELLALDNQLEIVRRNIEIQENALLTIRQEKTAAKVSQLAVNRFEAQVLHTRNRQYELLQQIRETENRLHFLTGKYPTPLARSTRDFATVEMDSVQAGLPSQLLQNRPDIRQAELELQAAGLDVQVARAHFYPSVGLRAFAGFQAFNPAYLINPESILLNAAGDLMAPLVNRNAIRAAYLNANERQIQAVIRYEQTLLNAYLEVVNQLSRIQNYTASLQTKAKEVEILNQSVTISTSLFRSARADYMEVLLTQREALDSRMELVEIKLQQMQAKVQVYQALGGGVN